MPLGPINNVKTKCKGRKCKGCHTPVRHMLLILSLVTEPVGECVVHKQWEARPTVTFPAAKHHRPVASTKFD